MVTGKAYVPSGHQNTEVFRPEGNLPAKGHPWREEEAPQPREALPATPSKDTGNTCGCRLNGF